jgi:hypothetical protein
MCQSKVVRVEYFWLTNARIIQRYLKCALAIFELGLKRWQYNSSRSQTPPQAQSREDQKPRLETQHATQKANIRTTNFDFACSVLCSQTRLYIVTKLTLYY